VTGRDGYCLHSTLAARPDTRELLDALRRIGEKCGPAVPSGVDFTHFDFQFMNHLRLGRLVLADIGEPGREHHILRPS